MWEVHGVTACIINSPRAGYFSSAGCTQFAVRTLCINVLMLSLTLSYSQNGFRIFSKIRYGSQETSRLSCFHVLDSAYIFIVWSRCSVFRSLLSYPPHARCATIIIRIWHAQCTICKQWIHPATINEVLLTSRSRNAKHLAGGDTNGFNKTMQGDLVVLSNFLLSSPSSSLPSLCSHL
jgi:hypothetical protein